MTEARGEPITRFISGTASGDPLDPVYDPAAMRGALLEGDDLHDDDDSRKVRVITDDERPFVVYGDEKGDRDS